MPNIEIKARYSDLNRAREVAERCKTAHLGKMRQVDTYFHTHSGRLKLRECTPGKSVLIPYKKAYGNEPSRSDYVLLPVENAALTKQLLGQTLGMELVVDKERDVYLIDNVRVHLDEVRGLGTFVEFEAVYSDTGIEAEEREGRKVWALMDAFGIRSEDVIDCSYIDLLKKNSQGPGASCARTPS